MARPVADEMYISLFIQNPVRYHPNLSFLRCSMSSISEQDYDYLCDLVYQFSRIRLEEDKRNLVASSLGKRLKERKLESFSSYCRLLESPKGEEELVHLIGAVSACHTHFFQGAGHFEFLKERALPDFEMRFGIRGEKHFRLWSAACASGEEAYSLAILLSEHFGGRRGYSWSVEASDASAKALKKAQTAVYSEDRLYEAREDLLRKYFQKGVGEWKDYFRVKKTLKNKIRFSNMHILQGYYPFQGKFLVRQSHVRSDFSPRRDWHTWVLYYYFLKTKDR